MATFWFFREGLRRFAPAQAGLKPHRWQTIKSDVTCALKRYGQSPEQAKPRSRLSGDWEELRARLSAAGYRWGLSRLARFCDAQGLSPSAVDDRVVAAYIDGIREQTFKTNPDRHHREVCRLWNRLAEQYPELQLQTVSLPCARELYTPKWEALSPAFQAEADTWLASMSEEGDLLSDTGPVRPLRPATIRTYRFALTAGGSGRAKERASARYDPVAGGIGRR